MGNMKGPKYTNKLTVIIASQSGTIAKQAQSASFLIYIKDHF